MTPELAELVRRYAATQECLPEQHTANQEAFECAMRETAAKHRFDEEKIESFVRRQWQTMCQKEDKRHGKGRHPEN